MATRLDAELTALQQRIGRFAENEAMPQIEQTDGFPAALWRKMGEEKLLGIGFPLDYGGSGGGWLAILAAGEAFVRGSRNMGMALSWMIHLIVGRFAVLGCGSPEQIMQWLPLIASGEITASLAISEPQTGSHPKYLRTSALRDGNDWVLNGEKSFLTNGPIAGLYIVLAVTGTQDAKKQMTAFLVPREAPGVSLTAPLVLGFLDPSPHCGIRLDACRVASGQVLGKIGAAFDLISKPFRDLEDVMLMGPVAGGMTVQLDRLAYAIVRDGISLTEDIKTTMGELHYRRDALRIVAYEAAAMLDSDVSHSEFPSLLLAFRFQAAQFQSRLAQFVGQIGLETDISWRTLAKDLAMTVGVAGQVAHIKQKKIGEAALLKKGLKRHADY